MEPNQEVSQVASPEGSQNVLNQSENVGQVKYAGFWIRYAAYFIDQVIIGIASFILGVLIGIFSAVLGLSEAGAEITSLISRLGSLIIAWGYLVVMTHNKQATLGKIALGIKVVREDGSRLSLGKIIIRETIGKLVSGIILLIGYIMAAFTEKKQALHDKFVSSVVIYKDPTKPTSTWLIVVIVFISLVVPLVIIASLSAVVLTSLSTAREKAQEEAARIQASSTLIIDESQIEANSNTGL